jgi:hypothetical protein
MHRPNAPVAAAIPLFSQALRRRRLTVYAFCRLHHLDRIQVQRLLNGTVRRITVDLADDIERATEGEVPIRSWRLTESRANMAVRSAPANGADAAVAGAR